MPITHSQQADNTFTPRGKIAWDNDHVVAGNTPIVNIDTSAINGALIYGGATFNAVYDPVIYVGYNISGQSGSTRINTSEPSLKFGLEGHFWNLTSHLMEWNWDYVSSDGMTTRRAGGFTINRSSHAVDWDLAGPTFHIWKTDVGVGARFGIDLTNGDNTTAGEIRIQGGSGEILAFGLVTAGVITDVDFGFGAISASGGWVSTDSNSVDTMIGATTIQTITASGSAISLSSSGANVNATLQNTSNSASSGARQFIDVAGSSSGDAYTEYHCAGVTGTCVGYDTSAQAFKISVDSSALGTNDRFSCDLNGHIGLSTALSATAWVAVPAGTTGSSSLRVPHGDAPSAPVDGDIWTTTSGLFVRINGVTVGPLT